MFGGFGLTELLVVLAIVLLVFGPKRLKNIGSDLGNAIKGFRKAVTDEETQATASEKDDKVIEGQVNEANQNAKSKQNTNV